MIHCPDCRPRFFLLAVGLAAVAAGCGDSDGLSRHSVSGVITLDGQPLPKGWIEFRPQAEGAVTASASLVKDGHYTIPRREGLVPGGYDVAISAREQASEEPPSQTKALQRLRSPKSGALIASPIRFAKELIPARYNQQTTLTALVKEGETNTFNFTMKSQ